MTSYADDFTVMATSSSLLEAEAEVNQHLTTLVEWTVRKELSIAPEKSSVTLFTPDTHQSQYHPQVRIRDTLVPLDRSPKILGINWDTHLTFGPHARNTIERATRSLGVLKALSGTNWGFPKETLVATYKAMVRPILNYGAPIWRHQVSPTWLGRLGVVQNAALRIATGNTRKAPIPHLHDETGVLPLEVHLQLCCSQFLASGLQESHPCHLLLTQPPGPRLMKHTLQSRYRGALTDLDFPDGSPVLQDGVITDYTYAKRLLRAGAVSTYLESRPPNRVLLAQPPDIDPAETLLPRAHRVVLSQLRSGYCSRLASYRHSVGWIESPLCPLCRASDQTVPHLFSCPEAPTDLAPGDLWSAPLQTLHFILTLPSFFDLPPLPNILPHQPP